MITIGGLARVIVSGNYRFRSWLRELLLWLGHQLGLVQRPFLQELPSRTGAGRTTEIRRVRAKVITTTTTASQQRGGDVHSVYVHQTGNPNTRTAKAKPIRSTNMGFVK